ncbi:hypothetical protein PM082_020841 [Marasmius tenuissimus]|nr:hypothetical protein PM082_020841 [Marasmius tenuissimus]
MYYPLDDEVFGAPSEKRRILYPPSSPSHHTITLDKFCWRLVNVAPHSQIWNRSSESLCTSSKRFRLSTFAVTTATPFLLLSVRYVERETATQSI